MRSSRPGAAARQRLPREQPPRSQARTPPPSGSVPALRVSKHEGPPDAAGLPRDFLPIVLQANRQRLTHNDVAGLHLGKGERKNALTLLLAPSSLAAPTQVLC